MAKAACCNMLVVALVLIMAIFTASEDQMTNTNDEPINNTQTESPLADNIRTLPFFVDKIFLEVMSISSDYVQLRVSNYSDITIDVPLHDRRRGSELYPGPFASSGSFHIDYYDGQFWRTVVPYPNILPDIILDDLVLNLVLPGEYLIFDYCLALHPIPLQGISHYRIVLDVLPAPWHVTDEMRQILREYHRAGGDIYFHGVGRPRHAVVAEFHWDGIQLEIKD